MSLKLSFTAETAEPLMLGSSPAKHSFGDNRVAKYNLATRNMAVLQGNRIIYPDGTMNKLVAQYLKAKVLGLFKARKANGANSKVVATTEKT